MANAQIDFTQGENTGGPGFALIGVAGTPVQVSNGDNSNLANWQFTMLDTGPGSALSRGVVQNGALPTYTFTPDVTGCYVILLTTTDNEGNVYSDTRVFGILELSGRLIPSYEATDNAMNFVISSVENTRGWSPFVQAYLKAVDAAGGGSYTENFTGSGPYTYSGPLPVPALIYLSGTPGFPFRYDLPEIDGLTVIVANLMATAMFVQTAADIGGVSIYGAGGMLLTNEGGSIVPIGIFPGDIYNYGTSADTITTLSSIAIVNQGAAPGAIQTVPIYGAVLNPQDAATYSVTVPTIGAGPVGGLSGAQVWYTATGSTGDPLAGRMVQDESGASQGVCPVAYYPGASSWTIQRQSSVPFRVGDSLAGSGTSQAVGFEWTGFNTVTLTVEVTATDVSNTGVYTARVRASFKNDSGTIRQVASTLVDDPIYDASMADVSITLTTDGTNIYLTYTNGALIGADTITYQFLITPEFL